MNILSIFITSNNVSFLLKKEGNLKSEKFSFYPSFQSTKDLEFLILSYLKSQNLKIQEVLIIPISTIYNIPVFGKSVNFLNIELKNKNDFLYIYLDNLCLYSNKNVSVTSFGLSKRSDNFISNRSMFATSNFTGDIEEIVYLSKSIQETFSSEYRKIVFGGDYFTNDEIPNEFKLNLISEILSSGFYEIYIDNKNEYPNFLNMRNNSSVALKTVEFEKFSYIISSEKTVELLLESGPSQKFINLKQNETLFLHFTENEKLKLKYKGKDIRNGELQLDTSFPGLFIDFRTINDKKKNLGIESFRKVLNSIEKNNDYSSL